MKQRVSIAGVIQLGHWKSCFLIAIIHIFIERETEKEREKIAIPTLSEYPVISK